LCKKHYYEQWWEARGGKPSRTHPRVYRYKSISEALSQPITICRVAGCGGKSQARGWCGAHYQRWRRFGDPLFHPPEQVRRCSVEGCDRTSNARQLCSSHYRRWQLYGDPLLTKHTSHVAKAGEKVCAVEDCPNRVLSLGLCHKRYSRLRKHGDVNFVPAPADRTCLTCGGTFNPGRGSARKYCGKACKPSGRIAGSVNKRSWVEKIASEDGWNCWLCGQEVNPDFYWPNPLAGSVDHVIPVSRGGTDARSNLRLAHVSCNSRKSNKLMT
jgi:hypothetical protein